VTRSAGPGRDRAQLRADERERERPAPRPDAPAPPRQQAILQAQRTIGNRAVVRMLARHADHDLGPEVGGGGASPAAPAAPAPGAREAAEAEAVETVGRLRSIHQRMGGFHAAAGDAREQRVGATGEERIRDTALLLNPPGSHGGGRRFSIETMTLRSDNAQLLSDNAENPADTAYYFLGRSQDNQMRKGPNVMGTVRGTTIIVRGKDQSGSWRDEDDLIGVFVHEVSHLLVSGYGEHPETTTDAASFDRYKDEFRAYFIEPFGNFDRIVDPDAKARAIRTHLVGTSATVGGYDYLRGAYWAGTAATNSFRQQVDAHMRPDGFNQRNSPRLDRLFQLLTDCRAGRATVEQVLLQISLIGDAERADAQAAPLIQRLTRELGGTDATRVRDALVHPRQAGYGREINPNDSPQVTTFLDAIANGTDEQLVEAYRAIPGTDRGALHMNAAAFVFADRRTTNLRRKARLYAMIVGRSFVYWERMEGFLAALDRTRVDARDATEIPPEVRTALRGLSFEVRLAFFRLTEDARRLYVDQTLPEAWRGQVLSILRGDAEP
jgi:hypothetical protein